MKWKVEIEIEADVREYDIHYTAAIEMHNGWRRAPGDRVAQCPTDAIHMLYLACPEAFFPAGNPIRAAFKEAATLAEAQ